MVLAASTLMFPVHSSAAASPSTPPPAFVPSSPPPQELRAGRWLYLGLGWSFFGLGVLGALLPVLPTTPFMILAAWAFSKSSPRFEHWLLNHKWFGSGVRKFRDHRVVPRKAKLMSWSTMSVTFTYCLYSGHVPWWGLLAQASLMAYGAWYVGRFPEKLPDADIKIAPTT